MEYRDIRHNFSRKRGKQINYGKIKCKPYLKIKLNPQKVAREGPI